MVKNSVGQAKMSHHRKVIFFMFALCMIENILLYLCKMDVCRNTYWKIAIKNSSSYWKMPCHHDFLKMSHHRTNTKYGENTSYIHQEIILRPKTAMMLLYLATFSNLTLNNINKDVFCLFFKKVPPWRTMGHTWT